LAFCAIVAQGGVGRRDRAAAEAAGACGRSPEKRSVLIPSPNDPFGRVLGRPPAIARRGFGAPDVARAAA
jgi:hypothetical protein